jgi:hypothetical protein
MNQYREERDKLKHLLAESRKRNKDEDAEVERLQRENAAIRQELGRSTLNATTIAENVRLTREVERLTALQERTKQDADSFLVTIAKQTAEVERLREENEVFSSLGPSNDLIAEVERLRAALEEIAAAKVGEDAMREMLHDALERIAGPIVEGPQEMQERARAALAKEEA